MDWTESSAVGDIEALTLRLYWKNIAEGVYCHPMNVFKLFSAFCDAMFRELEPEAEEPLETFIT